MTKSVATQFLGTFKEDTGEDDVTPKYSPQKFFTLNECWFIHSLNTSKIGLFNKYIAEECKVAVIVDGKEQTNILENKNEIFGKWDYLLVTIFGIKYTIRRLKGKKTDDDDDSRENRINNEDRFIIKNEESEKIQCKIKRFPLINAEENLPNNFKQIKDEENSPKYMQIDTGEITLCAVQRKPKETEAEDTYKFLEGLACKTAFIIIISHALTLKLNRFLDETISDLFKEKSCNQASTTGFLNKIRTNIAEATLNMNIWNENNHKLQEIQKFRIKFLNQSPINIENAYTVIKVWNIIESTFFLKCRISELEKKLDTLDQINTTEFEIFIQKYGFKIAVLALLFTGISAVNDFIELISKFLKIFL